MGRDTVIQAILRLKDELSTPAKRALAAVTQAQRGAVQGAGASARAMAQFGQASREAAGQVQGVGRAASALRSDKVRAMAMEMARTHRESRQARQELDKAGASASRFAAALAKAGGAGRAALSAAQGVGQMGAGLAAGGMMAGRALATPISYESRLNKMARVAFADKSAEGQIAGMRTLNEDIVKATKEGGGTRDNAAGALNALLAGNMEYGQASRMLPKILKASMGGDIAAEDLSKVILTGTKQGWFNEDEADEILDIIVKGGQEGSFEGRDMAKWIPELMSMAKGMKGKEGFKRLVAALQGQAVVGGSNDKAANQLANLLGKLFSPDAQADFVKLGIDLNGTLAKAAGKGMDPLTAIVKLAKENIFAKDKRFQDIKKKLEAAKDDKEKAELLEHMADIVQGSVLGKMFQDREAQLGFAGLISQEDYINKTFSNLGNSQGTVDTAYQVASQTTEFKAQQLQNEKDNAMFRTLQDVGPALNSVMDAATNLAKEFPGLATVVAEASTAIGVFSAGLAAAGGFRMLTGGGAGAAAAATGAATTGAGFFASAIKLLSRAAPWLAVGAGALDIAATESNDTLTRAQKDAKNAETYGETGGALAGAAGGAAVGSVVPVIGTALGAVIGGLLGWWAGGKAGKQVGEWTWGPSPETLNSAKEVAEKGDQNINFNAQLYVDGREMARVVNQYNSDESKRH